MGEAALALDQASSVDAQGWGFRLAQQAFAALLEDDQRPANFRIAALRASARARMTALSVDDRGQLHRWLTLQLATVSASAASKSLDTLNTVDALMSASVRADLPPLLVSRGLGSAEAKDPGSNRLVSQTAFGPVRQIDAGGLPPVSRPSMLSTLFR